MREVHQVVGCGAVPVCGQGRVHAVDIGVSSEDGLVKSQISMSRLVRLLADVCSLLAISEDAVMCTPWSCFLFWSENLW